MKRDIIGDIFLGGVLLSLLFLFSFPVYFSYNGIQARPIDMFEHIMSVCFTLAWILLCVWCCWKKRFWIMLGATSFALLAYLPRWFLPKVNMRIIMNGKSLLDTFLSMLLNRIYELSHAPFVGLVGIVSEKTALKMADLMLPSILVSYIVSQIVRYYHNAYVAEKKEKRDFADFRKANATRKPIGLENAVREAAVPLGTIVLNEKAEVASETFTGQSPDTTAATTTNIPAPEEAAKARVIEAPKEDATQVIALAAHAPTSKEETKVIPLPARAPSSADTTQVIALAAKAPTSVVPAPAPVPASEAPAPAPAPAQEEKPTSEGDTLDFPDVRGEAEKIDVFGENE